MTTESEHADDGALLDLLFVQDATASMGPYIKSVKENILEICQFLIESGRVKRHNGLQVGLLTYRDYPAEANGFVTKSDPFTYDLHVMEGYLSSLTAYGGGDPPEAFSTALEHAYLKTTGWRDEALKAIVVVTDAAPHGINERNDHFPDGAPPGVTLRDPIELTREMALRGYSLFILACEPGLTENTKYAKDFYKALADLSLGTLCALADHRMLAACIIGSLLEDIDLRKLGSEYRSYIAKLINEGRTIDSIIDELYRKLHSQGKQVTTTESADIYNGLDSAKHNYHVFMKSDTLSVAKKSLDRVFGHRIDLGCLNAIRKYSDAANAKEDGDFLKVSICFRNLGDHRLVLQMFDAELRNIFKDIAIPNSFVIIKKFRINVPVNFSLVCGRVTKNFSRTFIEDVDINLEQFFK